ncbi:hypothetical protein LX32DRAFT_647013 [Colletotrichum zoysiae]|uniref:Uncharacterized protein n=1 Tax=Colletotrichum zoysiae TaxID=1216348 RepID=A0AAD9H3H6_9PEZI|nr:hypothetical protein LX32DRAFT_647013 [Colletotrichum zoysiae]
MNSGEFTGCPGHGLDVPLPPKFFTSSLICSAFLSLSSVVMLPHTNNTGKQSKELDQRSSKAE